MRSVATRPIEDMEAYKDKLNQFVFRSAPVMWPIFLKARRSSTPRSEGEEERVLRAAQTIIDEGLARLVLVGRPEVIDRRIADLGLRLETGRDS